MTAAQREAKLQAQGGRCAICRCDLREPVGDRCPRTGQYRGLLCLYCNRGLGHFEDDPVRLASAIRYVEQYRREYADVDAGRRSQPAKVTLTGDELLAEVHRNPPAYVAVSPEARAEIDAAMRDALGLGPHDLLPTAMPSSRNSRVRERIREPRAFTTSWGEEVDLNDLSLIERLKTDTKLSDEVDAYIAQLAGRRVVPGERPFPSQPKPVGETKTAKRRERYHRQNPTAEELERRIEAVVAERAAKKKRKKR